MHENFPQVIAYMEYKNILTPNNSKIMVFINWGIWNIRTKLLVYIIKAIATTHLSSKE